MFSPFATNLVLIAMILRHCIFHFWLAASLTRCILLYWVLQLWDQYSSPNKLRNSRTSVYIKFTITNGPSSTLGARGFLREEPRSVISKAVKRGKIDECWENLWLPATFDWFYCTNRFELGSKFDPASWLEEPCRCVIIGCLLIDLVMLIESCRSMIVRFPLPTTRGFLSPLLFLLSLHGKRKPLGSG